MLRSTGLSTHAWNTALRSLLLLAGFPLLLTLLCFGLALMLADDSRGFGQAAAGAAAALPGFLAASLVVTAIWFAIAWRAHRWILDRATGAVTATREAEPRLWQLTEALCISRGMAVPRLAVIETPARNAFAAGMTADRMSVTVTRGLMAALDDRELSAVLAHELTHIRNGDARLGVVAAVFAGIISLGVDMVGRSRIARGRDPAGQAGRPWRSRSRSSSSSSSSSSGGGAALVGLVLVVLAGVLAVLLRFALSRQREYLADAGSVQMTHDPDAMISALRKVEGHAELPALPGQVKALMLDWPAGERGPGLYATHPTVADRIAALVRYAGGVAPLAPGPGPWTSPPDASSPQASPPPG